MRRVLKVYIASDDYTIYFLQWTCFSLVTAQIYLLPRQVREVFTFYTVLCTPCEQLKPAFLLCLLHPAQSGVTVPRIVPRHKDDPLRMVCNDKIVAQRVLMRRWIAVLLCLFMCFSNSLVCSFLALWLFCLGLYEYENNNMCVCVSVCVPMNLILCLCMYLV